MFFLCICHFDIIDILLHSKIIELNWIQFYQDNWIYKIFIFSRKQPNWVCICRTFSTWYQINLSRVNYGRWYKMNEHFISSILVIQWNRVEFIQTVLKFNVNIILKWNLIFNTKSDICKALTLPFYLLHFSISLYFFLARVPNWAVYNFEVLRLYMYVSEKL